MRTLRAVPALTAVLAIGCGSQQRVRSTPTRPTCEESMAGALADVARRVYDEAATGRIAAQAVRRVEDSTQLAAAVARGDHRAAETALRSLRQRQIVAIRVLRGAQLLAFAGVTDALGPSAGTIRDFAGRRIGAFTLAVQGVGGYTAVTQRITGAQLLIRAGDTRLASTLAQSPANLPDQGRVRVRGTEYVVRSFPAVAFPDRAARISVAFAPSTLPSCGVTPAQTRARAAGFVGRRIYDQERSSAFVTFATTHVQSSGAFRRAVARGDATAARRAIIDLFGSHIHIVRVRLFRGTRLLVDVGGPYVLAPVAAVLRDAGERPIGRVVLAVQDDMGYMLLAHRFTGAEVVMRVGSHQVMGTLRPGPRRIPDAGPVTYRGTRYEAVSFKATAFPTGSLRISLLVRPGARAR